MHHALYACTGEPLTRRRPRLLDRLRRWRIERRSRAVLETLTDRELKDIGVARCGIVYTAHEMLWIAGG